MSEEAGGWVYILASARNGTLYTGSTRSLAARVYEHREGLRAGFTRKYDVTRLVWFEAHESVAAAYKREQSIKRWRRAWKLALIEKDESAMGGFVSLPSRAPCRSIAFFVRG